jgi:N-acetylglucosamine malate deacetylase 1
VSAAGEPPREGGLDLLAFGAHPDDVELCCGGLLAVSARRGHRTGIVDLSRGELGSLGTPERRAVEAARAAEILGVSVRENLGFPDGFIHPYSGYEADPGDRPRLAQLARVAAVIRRLRPAVMVIPWTHERHPDHEAASELLTRAIFFAGVRKFETDPPLPPFSPAQVLRYSMRYELEPSFVVDISAVTEQKAAAIAAYSSQIGPGAAPAVPLSPGQPPPLIGSPLTTEAFDARDRYYGAMIGTVAGEPYLSRAVMGLHDPVAHFRSNAFPGALFFGRPR